LGVALAQQGKRVLVVDLDPQACLTFSLGFDPDVLESSLHDVLVRRAKVADVTRPVPGVEGLVVVPATIDLAGVEIELVPAFSRELKLKKAVDSVVDDFDFILIDCPPALDLLTLNALIAADAVLVPIQCEFFALEGISELMDTIDRIKNSFQHDLEVEGILLTMYDDRTNLTRQVANDLNEFFGDKVFQTIIPRSIRLAEAPSFGKTILSYDPRSRGAESYIKLAKEILDHEQTRQSAQGTR